MVLYILRSRFVEMSDAMENDFNSKNMAFMSDQIIKNIHFDIH